MLLCLCSTKDNLVLFLVCPQTVEIEFVLVCFGRKLAALWFVVTRVVEAFFASPGDTTELDIHQGVFYAGQVLGFNNDYFSPIAASFRNGIGR